MFQNIAMLSHDYSAPEVFSVSLSSDGPSRMVKDFDVQLSHTIVS